MMQNVGSLTERAPNYTASIRFDSKRDPYIAERTVSWDRVTKTPVCEGDYIVPVQVYTRKGSKIEFWGKPERQRYYVQDYFPQWLPLRLLIRGREGKVIHIEVALFNEQMSTPYRLLCAQKSEMESTIFETKWMELYRNYLRDIIPKVTRTVGPHFYDNGSSLGPPVFKIKKNEEVGLSPNALEKCHEFFGVPFESKADITIVSEVPLSPALLSYFETGSLDKEIGVDTCLGLITLVRKLKKENSPLELEALRMIKQNISQDSLREVVDYCFSEKYFHLIKIIRDFLKHNGNTLVGLGLFSMKDCVPVYDDFPPLAELIVEGIREELINLFDWRVFSEVDAIARANKGKPLFNELAGICDALLSKKLTLLTPRSLKKISPHRRTRSL